MDAEKTEEIKQQYLQACVELGNIEYQAQVLKEELGTLEYRADKVKNKMKTINERGAKLAATEQQGTEATDTETEPVGVL